MCSSSACVRGPFLIGSCIVVLFQLGEILIACQLRTVCELCACVAIDTSACSTFPTKTNRAITGLTIPDKLPSVGRNTREHERGCPKEISQRTNFVLRKHGKSLKQESYAYKARDSQLSQSQDESS